MAIDTTMFVADIPAGTYAVGDVIELTCSTGPANVRSSRGAAILKQITALRMISGNPLWEIHVKNSDWIDEVISYAGQLNNATVLDDHSGSVQFGCDNPLSPNSGWQVYAKCMAGGTSTNADSLVALIDIDYPSVSAVVDPDAVIGIPTTIPYDLSFTSNVIGGAVGANWTTQNVDYFKAGYQYCLQAVEMLGTAVSGGGFVAFSSAAGMGGLQRIIPLNSLSAGIRAKIRYSSKLVKGPMDIKLMLFNTTAQSGSVRLLNDYVKRATS